MTYIVRVAPPTISSCNVWSETPFWPSVTRCRCVGILTAKLSLIYCHRQRSTVTEPSSEHQVIRILTWQFIACRRMSTVDFPISSRLIHSGLLTSLHSSERGGVALSLYKGSVLTHPKICYLPSVWLPLLLPPTTPHVARGARAATVLSM